MRVPIKIKNSHYMRGDRVSFYHGDEKKYEDAMKKLEQLAKSKKNDDRMENPGKVDEGLWDKAKRASKHAFGEIRWPFVTSKYKEWGGKFE